MPLYQRRPSILTSRIVQPPSRAVPFQFKASAVPKMSLKRGPTSITSKFVAAPMQNPTISGPGSGGSMGNVLGNAATGALIGGGAKMAYDALTKPKAPVAPKAGASIPAVAPKPAASAAAKALGSTGALKTAAGTPNVPVGATDIAPPPEEPPVQAEPVAETDIAPAPEDVPIVNEEDPVTTQQDSSFWDSFDMGWRKGGLITMMKQGGLAYMAEGGLPEGAMEMNDYPGVYVAYAPSGVPIYMDENGSPVDDPTIGATPEGAVEDQFLAPVSEPDYAPTSTPSGDVSSAPATDPTQGTQSSDWLSPDLMGSIKGALPAAGAGALLAALLGSDFGSAGRQNQGVDMSKLSTLTPRTTDFGIGPARFVNYDEYGSQDQMPDVYGQQLYSDLGTPAASDFNMEQYEPSPDLSNFQDLRDADQIIAYADGGQVDGYYSYGTPVDPLQNMRVQALKQGGLPAYSQVPVSGGRLDFRQGSAVHGPGDGQSDDIPAMLADGEYVFDADTVAALGNGSTKAGALALDKMREQIRKHKRSAPVHKIPPPAKSPLAYLKGIK